MLAGPNGSGSGAAGARSGGPCSVGEGGPVARLERLLCGLLQPDQQQQGLQQGAQQALQQPAQHDSKPPGSAAGGAGGAGAAWLLQQLHGSRVSALSQVSEAAFEHMGAALAQARTAAQASRDLLYPNPNPGGYGPGSGPMGATVGGVPRIVLHPAEFGEKLRELRMTACEMNVRLGDGGTRSRECVEKVWKRRLICRRPRFDQLSTTRGVCEHHFRSWNIKLPAPCPAAVAAVSQQAVPAQPCLALSTSHPMLAAPSSCARRHLCHTSSSVLPFLMTPSFRPCSAVLALSTLTPLCPFPRPYSGAL